MVKPTLADAPHARIAAAALLVNAFIWGVSWWPFRTLQNEGLHPLWATAIVYGFAMLCVLVVRPLAWRAYAQNPALWVLALASGLTNVCFNWAVTEGDVVRVVLLFYLMPAWAVLLAWPILGEKPQPMALLRLALALVGVLLVLKHPDSTWPVPQSLIDYLALAGGLCFALVNIMLRKLRDAPSEARMMGMFSGGACMAAAVALWGNTAGWVASLPAPQVDWITIVVLLACAFLLSNLALQYGAARLRSSTTALVMLSEIVFATISSVLLDAATLHTRTLWGGALILAAASWAAWADGQYNSKSSA
jgi:drug/metabolite transporter (DMT)-like permease